VNGRLRLGNRGGIVARMSNAAEALSVVIPCYRSAESLPELIPVLVAELERLAPAHEIILVNDGSPDDTWPAIERLAATHPTVRGIDLLRNFGQHNALLVGIREARHPIVVTMDDDLQHPPSEIHRLLTELRTRRLDVVYGVPEEEQHGLWRDLASQATKLVLKGAMGADTARNISAFRVFRTQVRDAFADYRGAFVSIDVLLTWGTTRFGAVRVRHDQRKHGTSNYTLRKLMVHALNLITGFSTLPLQLASVVGFAFTLFGLLILAYVLGRYFIQGSPVPGFPFLASVIVLFSGAQLFALGIIGEYLSRVHFRVMDKPSYAVRARIGAVDEGAPGAER